MWDLRRHYLVILGIILISVGLISKHFESMDKINKNTVESLKSGRYGNDKSDFDNSCFWSGINGRYLGPCREVINHYGKALLKMDVTSSCEIECVIEIGSEVNTCFVNEFGMKLDTGLADVPFDAYTVHEMFKACWSYTESLLKKSQEAEGIQDNNEKAKDSNQLVCDPTVFWL